jgi:hypothetical protein
VRIDIVLKNIAVSACIRHICILFVHIFMPAVTVYMFKHTTVSTVLVAHKQECAIYIYIHVYSHTLDTCNVSQVAYLGILLCTHTPTHTFVHKCMHAQATVIMIVLAFSVLFYVKYQNATRDWGDTLTGFRYQVRNVKYCNCQTRN